MFTSFFFLLRDRGIPVNPTSFLRLQRALSLGLVASLDDLYTAARTILVKSEKYFDLYDQAFAQAFQGAEPLDPQGHEMADEIRALLEEWLHDPEALAQALGIDASEVSKLTPEELIQYFLDRIKDQTEAHQGGNRWIGTRGTSPVGHSGAHPGGMRVGGASGGRSAIKVAMDRRYRDYSHQGPLERAQLGEALKRLRHLQPSGPKDRINIDRTIYQTMRNGGEIEIVFDRSLKDRLKVILAIDNGGWSMNPYVGLVHTLFSQARSQLKDLRILYFHNTIYDNLWEDPPRLRKPLAVEDLTRFDRETRFIIVGDASMAPYELLESNGTILFEDFSTKPSIQRLRFIARTFPHSAWLNPRLASTWPHTYTIGIIREIFPMFELTIEGLERAVALLKGKGSQ